MIEERFKFVVGEIDRDPPTAAQSETLCAALGVGDTVLNVPQVARRMACSTRHVWRLIRAGKLEACKGGRKITRVRESSLLAYLASISQQQKG